MTGQRLALWVVEALTLTRLVLLQFRNETARNRLQAMANPATSSQLSNALPVVVGGLLAIGGSVVTQLVTNYLTVSREEDKYRRERLEGLVKALYANDQWLENRRTMLLFRNQDYDNPSPLDEVQMLMALHFPELGEEVVAVTRAQKPLLDFVDKQKIARLQDAKAWIDSYDHQPYLEAYAGYSKAVSLLVFKCSVLIGSFTPRRLLKVLLRDRKAFGKLKPKD